MTDSWYETVAPEIPITQGDMIRDCPVVSWMAHQIDLTKKSEEEMLEPAAQVTRADVIVMTQACDLEHGKVSSVILCPHLSLSDYRQALEESFRQTNQQLTTKAWKRHLDHVTNGYLWNLALLNKGKEVAPEFEHRIVDFHEVFTVPRLFLETILKNRGEERPRLLPPYREHLSQAFARFFMRVGLPVGVEKDW